MKYYFTLFFFLAMFTIHAQKQKPVSVIFDSDIGPDYDDVGAMALLHAFADNGEAKILATIACNKYPNAAATLSVLNTYFKRAAIPIGISKGHAVNLADFQHWSDTIVAKYPHKIRSNDQAEDALKLYRKILSQQPDKSVTLITVGFLTNLADLITSKPDEYSPLNGSDLIKKKVKKLVSMAGKFSGDKTFKEFNVKMDVAASHLVFHKWPTEIIYSGFEIGEKLKTGLPLVKNSAIKNSPVKDVFSICLPMAKEDNYGRSSWDETAVLVAVKGYKPYYTLQRGTIIVNEDGSNTWAIKGKSQYYLVEKQSHKEVEVLINNLIQHQPGER